MLDRLDSQPPTGAARMLARLVADFGREHKWGYALSVVLLGLVALSNTGVALLLKPVVNGLVRVEKLGDVRLMALEAFGLFVLRGAATYGSMVTLARIGNRIVASAQRRVFDRLLDQNLIFFQDRHSSEFIARLAIAANGVRDTLQILVQSAARDVLTVVGMAAVMIYQDPLVAIGALCVLPPLSYLIGRILKRVRKFARRSYQSSTDIMQTMAETVLGARIVKAFGLEGEMRARMGAAIRGVEGSANRIAVGAGLTTFVADSLAGAAIGFAIYYGSWRVNVLHADPGSFVSFLGALLLAYEPAKRLSRFPVDIQGGLVGASKIYEVLELAARRGGPAGRAGADRQRGARCARGRAFRLSAGRRRHQRRRSHRRAQPDDGAGRPLGWRQVDYSWRHSAFLCVERRTSDDRRPGCRARRSRFAAGEDRLRLARRFPVSRLDSRQHRLGAQGRHGSGDRRGGAPRQCA